MEATMTYTDHIHSLHNISFKFMTSKDTSRSNASQAGENTLTSHVVYFAHS